MCGGGVGSHPVSMAQWVLGGTVVERYTIDCCTSYIMVLSVIAMLKKLTEPVWVDGRIGEVDEKSKNHWIFI